MRARLELKGKGHVIARAAAKALGDVPDRVFRAVDVWEHLEHVDRAFRRLDAGRVWIASMAGASPVRIAETEKWHYAHGRGLVDSPGEYERFVYLIDAMDDTYMSWYGEQQKGASNGEARSEASSASDTGDDDTEE